MNPFFEQKSGNPERLDGRLTAYALIEAIEGAATEQRPGMREGSNLFSVQADCRHENTMEEFFKTELGSSLKQGLDQVLQRLRESGLWPEQNESGAGKDENNLVHGMAELIPIMARIVSFESEDEVLSQEGDIYFLGTFSNFQAASMATQAFSLLYQFRFREQERGSARRSIEELLSQIESELPEHENFRDYREDLERKLLGSYIPALLYNRQNQGAHDRAVDRFRQFMNGYRFPEDVDTVVRISSQPIGANSKELRIFELLLKKMVAMAKEDFGDVATIQDDIRRLSDS